MFEKFGRFLDDLLGSVTSSVRATRIDPVTENISIPYPESGPASLRLEVGVGKIRLSPASGDKLVEGTITYNVQEWAPQTSVNGQEVKLRQGKEDNLNFWPGLVGWKEAQNDWTLALGAARPYALSVSTGIAKSEMFFGGLPLTSLKVEVGTGESKIDFERPNPQQANKVEIRGATGAVHMRGLLNANTERLSVKGGTGELHLDFTGESLLRNMEVEVGSGVGETRIHVKPGVPARISVSQGLGGCRISDDFRTVGEHVYETSNFNLAAGPRLTIKVSSGVGSVVIGTVGDTV